MMTFAEIELKRIQKKIKHDIDTFQLNLKDLVVYTEAASGYYFFTPLICAMAGASKVYAVTRNTSWGKASEIIHDTMKLAEAWGYGSIIKCSTEKIESEITTSDIIMNMGHVRPIDRAMIDLMKPTAVIPLMWETWEIRPGEIDLDACDKKGIMVMGTDEKKLEMFPLAGYLVLYLLNQCKVEIYKNKFFVFASGPVLEGIHSVFTDNHIPFYWTGFDQEIPKQCKDNFISPHEKQKILDWISNCEAVICAEHVHPKPVIAVDGIITPEELINANDTTLLLYKGGIIDYPKIKELGIWIYPDKQVPFGTFTTYSYELGPGPVLELNAAGIKVGEVMTRARLMGLSIKEAEEYAFKYSPAMLLNASGRSGPF